MRTCKVYCTYFGVRRGRVTVSPANATETLEVFKKNIENDMALDCGVKNMDIIVVNNNSTTITHECVDYLNEINGIKTPYGKIVVLERENKGGSLGAFSHAFDVYGENYDYWVFCEDDIRITYPRYYEMVVDELQDEKLGFLSFTNINHEGNSAKTYVSGGFGAARKDVLDKVKVKFGKLRYDEYKNGAYASDYGGFGHSELYFTNPILHMGYELRTPRKADVIPLADNWYEFPPQAQWYRTKNIEFGDKKFLAHIGL